jgi:iron complex transport system substrate-binding protein
LIFAAGASDRLVAVSTADNYPSEIESLQKLDALPLNFEALVALNPDVVVLNEEINRLEDADRLAGLGVATFITRTNSIHDVPEEIRTLGRLLDTSEAADRHAGLLQAAMDSLQRLVEPLDKPRVLFLIGYNTLYAFGENGFIHDVISLAGGESITRSLQQNPVLNEEYVLAQDPDFILIAVGDSFRASDLTDAHPSFRELAAVRNSKVRVVDADEMLRPGPRLISGAYSIANIIHPELFSGE